MRHQLVPFLSEQYIKFEWQQLCQQHKLNYLAGELCECQASPFCRVGWGKESPLRDNYYSLS